MRSWHTYICMALMGILAACTGDDRLTSDGGGAESVSVRIVLSTGGGTGSFTRVTPTAPGDGNPDLSMEEGEAYECYINPYDAQVLLFTAETAGNDGGEFVGRASFTDVWPLAGETGKYHLSGILEGVTESDLGSDYQVVVLCNTGGTLTPWMDGAAYSKESSLTGVSRNELIGGLTYQGYTAAFTGALTDPSAIAQERAARIPMWGIEPLEDLQKENSLQINVLRTMAKVRIKFDVSDCTLNSITLNRAHNGGYMAAQEGQAIDASGGTNYNDDTSTTGIQLPSIPTEAGDITTGVIFTQVTGADGEKAHVIYIPEYRNMTDADTPADDYAYMTLGITSNGIAQDYILHFAEYTSDSGENPTAPEWDIIRNDIYEYTITGVTPAGGLKANVRVMPWEHEKMDYELTQNPVVTIGWSEGWPVCYDGINDGVPTCYENEYYYATFYVDVSIPEGVKWQAHLTNPIDFEFDPDYADHGYAHIDENSGYTDYYGNTTGRVTVRVRPKSVYNAGVRRTTNLYFTLETLVGGNKKATIKWWADNPDTDDIEGNGPFPMLGDTNDPPGEGKMVRIVQIAESEWEGYRSNLLAEWKEEPYEVQQAAAAEE